MKNFPWKKRNYSLVVVILMDKQKAIIAKPIKKNWITEMLSPMPIHYYRIKVSHGSKGIRQWPIILYTPPMMIDFT